MKNQPKNRVCLDCDVSFVGNPRARYCPRCRELRRIGTNHQDIGAIKPGFLKRFGMKIEPIKKYLGFWRLVILNVIFLIIGSACVWYLNSLPFSYETQEKLESFAPSNLALVVLLIWGSVMRVFYWYKENKSDDRTFWKEGYWKQLVAWLFGVVFTEFWAMFFLLI